MINSPPRTPHAVPSPPHTSQRESDRRLRRRRPRRRRPAPHGAEDARSHVRFTALAGGSGGGDGGAKRRGAPKGNAAVRRGHAEGARGGDGWDGGAEGAQVCACVCACVRACVCVSACACGRAGARVRAPCVRVCMCVCYHAAFFRARGGSTCENWNVRARLRKRNVARVRAGGRRCVALRARKFKSICFWGAGIVRAASSLTRPLRRSRNIGAGGAGSSEPWVGPSCLELLLLRSPKRATGANGDDAFRPLSPLPPFPS